VTRVAIVPARDVHGQMLLELDRPREAHIDSPQCSRTQPLRRALRIGAIRRALGGHDQGARVLRGPRHRGARQPPPGGTTRTRLLTSVRPGA
jgi:hypothetical protein